MRDIRGDLQDRVERVRQQIRAEQTQFEALTAQLKRERDSRLEDLRAQLQLVTKLLDFATWHHEARFAVAHALALAATAEISATAAARQFAQAQNGASISCSFVSGAGVGLAAEPDRNANAPIT